jgi:SAM-dependent methyltransferase
VLSRWPLGTARVLDVGCALGTSLSQFGPGSVGLDNNPEAIAFCRSLGLDARFADVDDHETGSPVAGDVFDYLWVADILEHLEAPRLLLRELSQRLAPGGRLLLLTSVLPEQRQARWLARKMKMRPFDAQVHYHQWTTSTLQHLLARSGYRLVKVHVPVPPTWGSVDRFIPRRIAPRVIAEAEPDADLERMVARSESRNRRLDADT